MTERTPPEGSGRWSPGDSDAIYLVVADQRHTDGSTNVVVGYAPTREAAQSWVNVLGFEMDVFRGRMTAWLREHPDPNPLYSDDWVLPLPGSEVRLRERAWYRQRDDAEEEMRRGMLCPLGARADMSDDRESWCDGPPNYYVEVVGRVGRTRAADPSSGE